MLQPFKDTFNPEDHPDLLVGLAAADDAAVYRLNDELAIVNTTDFFPPVVDDPYDFGAIAAANALSDIYAMGAKPIFAINLVAFPDGMDLNYLREILRGGAEKVAEAGAVIAGGHSIVDHEPKYGLAVTGTVHPDNLFTKGSSRPGDILLLTKKLGTGVVTTALKRQIAAPDDVSAAAESMKHLNVEASLAAHEAGVKCVTDITGFGLLGHAHEVAHLSGVRLNIYLDKIQWLPGAWKYGELNAFPGGMGNNEYFYKSWVVFEDGIAELAKNMLWTPETSGGLLMAVSSDRVEMVQDLCKESYVIGEVDQGYGEIQVFADGGRTGR